MNTFWCNGLIHFWIWLILTWSGVHGLFLSSNFQNPVRPRGSCSERFYPWIPGLGEICPSTTISCPDAWTTCIANIESFPPDINAKTLILNFFLLNLNFSLGKIMNRINISNESLARKGSSEMMLDRWRNFRELNSALASTNQSQASADGFSSICPPVHLRAHFQIFNGPSSESVH